MRKVERPSFPLSVLTRACVAHGIPFFILFYKMIHPRILYGAKAICPENEAESESRKSLTIESKAVY